VKCSYIHLTRCRVDNARQGFQRVCINAKYDQLVKPHVDNSVVVLTALLAVFTESYRLLRVNESKELVNVRSGGLRQGGKAWLKWAEVLAYEAH